MVFSRFFKGCYSSFHHTKKHESSELFKVLVEKQVTSQLLIPAADFFLNLPSSYHLGEDQARYIEIKDMLSTKNLSEIEVYLLVENLFLNQPIEHWKQNIFYRSASINFNPQLFDDLINWVKESREDAYLAGLYRQFNRTEGETIFEKIQKVTGQYKKIEAKETDRLLKK